ncbi:MAG: box helicase protein, partial [Gaiellaceae bacterium]|nr:box helicase protein [Gaiellaceae bacterium]
MTEPALAPAWDELLAGEELAYLATEPPRAPRTAALPEDLHPKLREALARQGIEELYAHQAEAWAATRGGGNVIVTTGTA